MIERRWAGVSGFAFIVSFLVSMVLLGDQLGSVGDPDEQFTSYFEKGTNRARDIVGAFVLAAAALAFVSFSSGMYAVLTSAGGHRVLALIGFGSGVAFAALILASAAALSAVASSIAIADLFDERPHEFVPDTLRLTTQAGFMTLVFAMWAAAASVASVSFGARSAGLFPSWLAWLGVVAAVALLFSFFSLPAAALAIWVLATSLVLLRSPRPALSTP